MSRLQKRIQQARHRGVYVLRNSTRFDIFVDSEWLLGPRELGYTKRDATALAYKIAISKTQKIVVTNT